MGDYTVSGTEIGAHEIHLQPGTVETVLFPGGLGYVTIVSLDGAAPIYFTVDGSVPVVGGARCYVIPAAIATYTAPVSTYGPNAIKMISAGNPVVSVQRGL